MKTFQAYWPYAVLTGCSFIVLYTIFGAALWRPNDFVFMLGGDGNIIYYNVLYHVQYGQGVMLTSMNYPEPECIFLTDAQAMVAITSNYLNRTFPWIGSHVIGMIHSLMMVAIWLQYVVLYKIFDRLRAPQWMAILFALAIGTLSPQLMRISYGHLGLVYPFVIPLGILWLWDSERARPVHGLTVVFVATTLFLGFNNPYLLVIVSIMLLCYGATEWLVYRKDESRGLAPILFGFGFLVILYVITSILDPYGDRIHHQWGHFYYASTVEGLLWGYYSLLNEIIAFLGFPYVGRSEARATISLISLFVLLGGGVYAFRQMASKQFRFLRHPSVILAIASGVSFLYASSFLKSKWWYWLTEDSGFISMIKATGRLSWISYYALSILSVAILLKWLQWNKPYAKQAVLFIGIFWIWEGHRYITDHVKPPLYENHFSEIKLKDYTDPKREVVDFDKYQAIYSVPVLQSWNDNMIFKGDWATELHTLILSSATGIPMLSAKLSRAPVGRSLENIQLTAHPLIRRTLPGRLDTMRPILLIKTSNIKELLPGEQMLVDIGRLVYRDEQVDLYELWPQDINKNSMLVDSLIAHCGTAEVGWYYYNGFNIGANDCAKNGQGGYQVTKDWKEIDRIVIPDTISGWHELSIWSYVNIERAGMPQYEVFVFNPDGSQKSYQYIDSRSFVDTQDGWMRMHKDVELNSGDQVLVKGRGNYPMCIDELLLKKKGGLSVCMRIGKSVMIDNYILE